MNSNVSRDELECGRVSGFVRVLFLLTSLTPSAVWTWRLQSSQVLIIKPTFIGPTAILTFLGALVGLLPMTVAPIDQLLLLPAVGFVVLLGLGQYFACTSLRSYFRAVDEMQRDLRHMRLLD